jgi:hypothetical protein
MKKITVVCIFVLFSLILSFNSSAQEQAEPASGENPMASFMNAKWGISAQEFSQTFEYSSKLKKSDQFYQLEDFDLATLTIKKIKFKFESKVDEKLTLRSSRNLDQLYLTEVLMLTKPEDFETLLQIFKVKYGEPTKYDEFEVRDSAGEKFPQKVARWENKEINRMIVMEKQASKLIDGMVMFIPIEKEKPKEKKDVIKTAAEKL